MCIAYPFFYMTEMACHFLMYYFHISRVHRWRPSTASAMRRQVTALLWASIFLLGATEAQHCLSGDSDPQPFLSFTQPVAQRVVRSEADGLAPLYNFAQAFLKVVQPNPLPEGK